MPPDLGERVGTGAAARCVDGRPAKPARRETLHEFLRVANDRIYTPTPVVRGSLDLRLLIGRLFGCDSPRRPRLERRSPGCSIVFYIDAEQAKMCNLHGRPSDL